MKRNKCTIMEVKIIERYIVFDYLFMKGTFVFLLNWKRVIPLVDIR